MLGEVKGLVLRVTNVGESDRLLTIYTEESGIVTAMAKGSRKLKSNTMSATMQFCYSSFILYSKSDKYWIREATLHESFYGIRGSIEGLALAGYIVDVLSEVATAEADVDLLRLALNSLYAISEGISDVTKIKAAFEIRSMAILGFMPEVIACATCGEREGDFFFDVMAAQLECHTCHRKRERTHTTLSEEHETHLIYILSPGAKVALSYLVYAPIERLYSFNLPQEDMALLSRATEGYLLNHLECSFKTLEFYNEVKP